MSFKKLVKQSSKYLVGEFLVILASFVSFPILTRILSKGEYGAMSLIAVSCGMLEPIAALGTHFSLLRFYPYYKERKQIKTFLKYLIFTSLSAGIIISGAAIILVDLFGWGKGVLPLFGKVFLVALGLMLAQNIFNLLHSFFRMEEKIFICNLLNVSRKYIGFIISIWLLFVYRNLIYFYLGQFFVSLCLVFILLVVIFKTLPKSTGKINFFPFAWEVSTYGLPLAMTGIILFFFQAGDRYVIAYFLGTEKVAVYSVATNIGTYIKESIVTAINLSLFPIIFKYWEEKEVVKVQQMFSSLVKYYFLIAALIVGIFYLAAEELIILVASAKYDESAAIAPVVILNIMVNSFNFPFSAGLHLQKDTFKIFAITLVFTVLNVVFNILMVPVFGIVGSAYAGLMVSCLMIGTSYFFSRKYLSFKIPFRSILVYTVLTLVVCYCVNALGGHFVTLPRSQKLLLKAGSYLAFYFCLVIAVDGEIRNHLKGRLIKITAKMNGSGAK